MAAVKIQHKNLLTKYSTEEKLNALFAGLGLEYGPRPQAEGRAQDRGHSFSQYGPPGRQIYVLRYVLSHLRECLKMV